MIIVVLSIAIAVTMVVTATDEIIIMAIFTKKMKKGNLLHVQNRSRDRFLVTKK